MARLSSAFAGLGALLAAMGLYGLMSYTVAHRTNEIGIRMALGATEGDMNRMVLKSALILVVLGVLLGIPLAFWIQRFGVTLIVNLDGRFTIPIAAAAAMIIVAMIAAYVPARTELQRLPAINTLVLDRSALPFLRFPRLHPITDVAPR